MSRHPGCDNGTHDVEVTVPSCGHTDAPGDRPCPRCGARPVAAIAIAMNETILTHNRLQRAHELAHLKPSPDRLKIALR